MKVGSFEKDEGDMVSYCHLRYCCNYFATAFVYYNNINNNINSRKAAHPLVSVSLF